MRLSLRSASHCDFSALMLLQDQPQRPSTSPRSMASEISALPGKPEISRSLTPKAFLSTLAKTSGSEPEPLPATVNALVNASPQVLTGDDSKVAHRLISLAALPIQVSLVASNFALVPPISGSIAMPRANMPKALPSFGLTL